MELYSEVELVNLDHPLLSADEILGILPKPACTVAGAQYENIKGSFTVFRVRFEGLPFEGVGGTVEEAAEHFEWQSTRRYETWADIPEGARAYANPAAFLWIRVLAITGNLQPVIVASLDPKFPTSSAFSVANGA